MSPFQPKLTPTSEPRRFTSGVQTFSDFKDTIRPHTILLSGAVLQLLICVILPLRWSIVPASIVLLNSIITTVIQMYNPHANGFNSNVVSGRTTSQIPLSDGTFSDSPGLSPLVVFQLGAQWNHPLGILAPGVADLNTRVGAMMQDVRKRRDEFGYLTSSVWRSDDRCSNNAVLTSFYFRDIEGLHRFAHDKIHREAWDWWNKTKYSHIGIFHETFCVPARGYEGVYVNCSPLLMGRLSVRVKHEKGEDKWVNGLVSADTPALKTQWARLGRDEKGFPKENFQES